MRNINSNVTVKLKNGVKFKGRMVQCDDYMNIIMEGAKEIFEDKQLASYGTIFIRGNNVIYITIEQ
ncbi:RNA chaperone Hfq [Candidatus Bathyarchaeota archaeon]|nr:RNA chaperone Hfq [Candidatus Bathyarchaeota archaeon]